MSTVKVKLLKNKAVGGEFGADRHQWEVTGVRLLMEMACVVGSRLHLLITSAMTFAMSRRAMCVQNQGR